MLLTVNLPAALNGLPYVCANFALVLVVKLRLELKHMQLNSMVIFRAYLLAV